MDKDKFIEIINQLEDLTQEEEKFNDMLTIIDPEFGGGYIYQKPISIILDMLKELMNDKFDYIGYYMYDMNFGKDWEEGTITDEDGSDIPLRSAEDLYNIIISNQN